MLGEAWRCWLFEPARRTAAPAALPGHPHQRQEDDAEIDGDAGEEGEEGLVVEDERSSPAMSMPTALASQPISPKKAARVAFGPSRNSKWRHGDVLDRATLAAAAMQLLVEHDVPAIARDRRRVRDPARRGGRDRGRLRARAASGARRRRSACSARRSLARAAKARASSCTPVKSVRRSAEGSCAARASFSSRSRSAAGRRGGRRRRVRAHRPAGADVRACVGDRVDPAGAELRRARLSARSAKAKRLRISGPSPGVEPGRLAQVRPSAASMLARVRGCLRCFQRGGLGGRGGGARAFDGRRPCRR